MKEYENGENKYDLKHKEKEIITKVPPKYLSRASFEITGLY
jgi:hypothetical protein